MQHLIIFTHPNHNSLNYKVLEMTVERLQAKGEDYKIIDLYQDSFNPVLRFDKERRRRDLHKDPELLAYQELINWADNLIFIHPIFWSRPPAMLLGFFDRVFASNYAYRYDDGKALPTPLLKGKSALVIASMKAPNIFYSLFLGNPQRKLMGTPLLKFCGIGPVKYVILDQIEKPENDKLKRIAGKLTRALG